MTEKTLSETVMMGLIDTYANTAVVNGIRSPWAQMARASAEIAVRESMAQPAPAERKPLTQPQIEAAINFMGIYDGDYETAIARAIEAAHNIK